MQYTGAEVQAGSAAAAAAAANGVAGGGSAAAAGTPSSSDVVGPVPTMSVFNTFVDYYKWYNEPPPGSSTSRLLLEKEGKSTWAQGLPQAALE
jgi:hypothetical protein